MDAKAKFSESGCCREKVEKELGLNFFLKFDLKHWLSRIYSTCKANQLTAWKNCNWHIPE